MMNKLYNIALGLIVCLSFVACNDNEGNSIGFSVDKSDLVFAAEGGADIIQIESNDSWTISVSEPWLSVSPASGMGTMACKLAVDSSLVNNMRSATVRFIPAANPAKSVTVKQMGYGKMIVPDESEISIESSAKYEERFFETTVTTNVKFSVKIFDPETDSISEWLTADNYSVELDKGARPRTTKLRFDWRMNNIPEQRVAEIKLIPEGEGADTVKTAVISVFQKPALKIEDNRAGDSLALVLMYDLMNCWSDAWDTGENLQYWEGVTLWEASDKDLPKDSLGMPIEEAVGRVRSVRYYLLNTKESIPAEIRHLKYLESLTISSNTNTMLLDIELGSEICELEHLKYLTIFSYGLVSLPKEFVKLGRSLVALDLSGNNFTSIPSILTPGNFPKLKSLSFVASRRWNFSPVDLRKKSEYESEGGIGLNIDADIDEDFRRLFLWEDLEELAFSNCYIEGSIPDFKVGEDSVVAYTQRDVDAFGGDTIQYLADNAMPKILPKCRMLRLNLNFFTGKLPDWLLYHPHLLDWAPDLLIFNQQEKGLNSEGKLVGFDNEPETFDYYYDNFPGTRKKYEISDVIGGETSGETSDETNDEITEE